MEVRTVDLSKEDPGNFCFIEEGNVKETLKNIQEYLDDAHKFGINGKKIPILEVRIIKAGHHVGFELI